AEGRCLPALRRFRDIGARIRLIPRAQAIPAATRGSRLETADHPRTTTCNPLARASCLDLLREGGAAYQRHRRSVYGRCARTARWLGRLVLREEVATVET